MTLAMYESKLIHFDDGLSVRVSRTPIGYCAQMDSAEDGPQGEGNTILSAIADLNERLEAEA